MGKVANDSDTVLLVVDDESAVCRALKRLLRNKAGEIISAETPRDAETILQTKRVTHVICDHLLGPGQPLGLDIAKTWKSKYPSLQRVAILTGTNLKELEHPASIDHMLPKTTDPVKLAEIMGFSPTTD